MNWIKDFIPTMKRNLSQTFGGEKDSKIPEGLWRSCDACGSILYIPELKKNSYVCSKCSHHFKINVKERIEITFDQGTYQDLNKTEAFKDYLKFKDTKKYKDRFQEAQSKTESDEALSIGVGTIKGKKVVSAIFEFVFLVGSMGAVVGKSFTSAVDYAVENSHPLLVFSTSGGARMQESMISLFQMGKTAAAVKKLKNKKLPFISVLVDPCYGGVTASLAMLGDLILSEPKARIGFSGKRVIQDTVKEDLPKDLQTAETQLENGFVDKIVDRKKDMIIVSGFNVYPSDVEEVAMQHQKILEAGCIGVSGKNGQELVKLFVSVVEGETITEDEILEHCRNNLTAYKVPKLLEIVDEIPKSNVGKILRRELREKN